MGFFFLFLCLLSLALQTSNSATLVVDGVTQWSDPKANIGDTIIFKHKNQYYLYIFRTIEAYTACNFNLATPLSNPNSTTYTWRPSRPGNFYFAFYNGTEKPCQEGQKLTVTINPHSISPSPAVKPEIPPENSPPATPGGVIASSPAYPWPFQPREKANGPTTTSVGIPPVGSPANAPGMAGSIPFIDSNPAVPLPTGEVDSSTIRPLPTPANHSSQGLKVVSWIQGLVAYLCFVIMATI